MSKYRVTHMFRDPESGVFITRANEDQIPTLFSKEKIESYVERGYLVENSEERPRYTPLAGVNFASDEAAQLANDHGVTADQIRKNVKKGSGKKGAITADDVRKAGNIKD